MVRRQEGGTLTGAPSGRGFWERSAANHDRSMLVLGGPIPAAIAGVVDLVRGSERGLEVASGTGLFTAAMAPAVRDVYQLGVDLHDLDAVVAANVLHPLPDLEGGLSVVRAKLE